jgi:hypothetical protein
MWLIAPSRLVPLSADAPLGQTEMLHRASQGRNAQKHPNPPPQKYRHRLRYTSWQRLIKNG